MRSYLGICIVLLLLIITKADPNCSQVKNLEEFHKCRVAVRRWYFLKDKHFQECCEALISIGLPCIYSQCELKSRQEATITLLSETTSYELEDRSSLSSKCVKNRFNKCIRINWG